MKFFATIQELKQLIFRTTAGKAVTVDPGTQTSNPTLNIPDLGSGSPTKTLAIIDLAQTLTNKSIDADTNTITNIDNNEIKAAAGILYSKLNLTSSIVNVDVAAAAAIARTKLASGTNDHVIINDGSGILSSEASLAIVRGGTGQATKTAGFDALAPSTTKGDLVVHNGTNNVRQAVGADGTVLTANSAQATGYSFTSVLSNPMDSAGDLIVGGSGGAAVKLDSGTQDFVLTAAGAASPVWQKLINVNIDSAAAISFSKLATLTSGNILVGNVSNVATSVAVTGDVLISNTGVTSIGTGVIVNADINAAAAIAGTKVSPVFGAQDLSVNTNAFFVDSTNKRAAIGTASFTTAAGTNYLEVRGATSPRIIVSDPSTSNPGYEVWSNGNNKAQWIWNESTTQVEWYNGNVSSSIPRMRSGVNGGMAFRGTSTNDNAGQFDYGEFVESSVTSATSMPATSTFGDVTSITLTAGDWEISCLARFDRNGATQTQAQLVLGIGTASGNSQTGLVDGVNKNIFDEGLATYASITLAVPSYRVSISGSTTYFLKIFPGAYSAGTPQFRGRISARRMR